MEKRGLHHLQWPTSDEEMTKIKSKFEKIRGFPNCCGAIDTTHITMCLPLQDPDNKVWTDREKNHSMLLQAIVDPDMRLRDIVTGWPGKMSDSLVLKSSNFFKLCEKGKRLNGKTVLFSQGSELREYIVGDSGFPLLPWLMTPYRGKGKGLSEVQTDFNKRHFATRMVARRALARLKEMWKIIHGAMWRPDKHRLPRIILVCCLLHNIVIDMEDDVQDEISLSHCHDESYRQQTCESADLTASDIREKLSFYFLTNLAFQTNLVQPLIQRQLSLRRPPQPGFYKLNIDGSWKDISKAGGGGVIRRDNGTWFMGFSSKYHSLSPLAAELQALRDGLLLAKQFQLTKVEVETDAKTILPLLEDV
ncbi:Protein ALP1-like [Bienertia sinuspersici]